MYFTNVSTLKGINPSRHSMVTCQGLWRTMVSKKEYLFTDLKRLTRFLWCEHSSCLEYGMLVKCQNTLPLRIGSSPSNQVPVIPVKTWS